MAWGTRRRRYGVVATAWLLALSATACAQDSGRHLTAEPAPDASSEAGASSSDQNDLPDDATDEAMTLVWSTEGAQFASRPVVAGGVVVALAADRGALSLVAYDPSTGTELWRRPSTASLVSPGVGLSLMTDRTLVFHMAPGSGASAAIEAVDGATGEPAWQTEDSSNGFRDPLGFCDRSEDTLCINALGGSTATGWQIDADTGALIEPPALRSLTAVPPPGTVSEPTETTEGNTGDRLSLGSGLYYLLDSREVALVVDDEIVWQRPPGDLFGGRPVSPDYGWMVWPAGNVLVVWLGAEVGPLAEGPVDLPVQHTAGIDTASGEARWVAEGGLGCGRLVELELSSGYLRCHTTGTMTVEDRWAVGFDVHNVVEEFNPWTGEAGWSFDLGPSSAIMDDHRQLVRLNSHRIAMVRDDGSAVGLDLNSGAEVDVDRAQVGWCMSTNEYEYDYQGSYSAELRRGEAFTAVCNLAGAIPSTPAAVDFDIGVQAGDVFVWMDQAGLHGAQLSG